MEQNENSELITTVPIIGIQHKVMVENGEFELQIEYFALNPDKFKESFNDDEGFNLWALLDVINSGTSMLSELQSTPGETHLLRSLFKNENSKSLHGAMSIVLDSDLVDAVINLKYTKSTQEILINPGVN